MILVIESLNKNASKILAERFGEEIIDCENYTVEEILNIFLKKDKVILLNLVGNKD